MSTQNWFVLTTDQRNTAIGFNPPGGPEIDPRPVDGLTPGVGINLNDLAVGVAPGAVVTLVGMYVAPKRIVDDEAYPQNMKDFLLTLPYASLESETIFAPPPDIHG